MATVLKGRGFQPRRKCYTINGGFSRRGRLGHKDYRTTPSSGELAVAYSFLGMRPAR